METNEIILGLTALVLIVFSLVVSLVVPKRNPDFPGRRMGVFVTIVAVLVIGQLTAVIVLEESHDEAEAAEPAAPAEGGEAPPPDEPGAVPEPGASVPSAAAGDPAAGKEVFASAGCGSCHTLADAGSTGQIGPNLDDTQPPPDLVVERVTNGAGAMPSFADTLSPEQIQDVAAYVSSVAGG